MSVTADTSLYTALKLPPVFMGHSSTHDSDSNHSFNYSNNSTSRTSSSLKYQLSYGTKTESKPGGLWRTGQRVRMSGTNYLKNLPSLFARNKETFQPEEDLSTRSAFPEGASVSLPTSTTTLEYLLRKRSSRFDAADESQDINTTVKSETQTGRKPGTSELWKTRSEPAPGYPTPGGGNDEAVRKLFYLEPCLYTQQMFMRASRIIEYVQNDVAARANLKSMSAVGCIQNTCDAKAEMEVENTPDEIMTLELAFETLKFEKLFEAALAHIDFYVDNPRFQNYARLVNVVLYDVQNRKFQRRTPFPGEAAYELCNEIEEAIIAKKTRLQSFFAKTRIKNNAPSINHLLPESLRNMNTTQSKIPVYMWINQIKTSIDCVIDELLADGFTKLSMGDDMSDQSGKVFMADPHCTDLLVFPSHLSTYLKQTQWVKVGHLVEQDKSSCMAAQTVLYLLGTDKDVIHVNVGAGLTTAHLVSLLRKKSPQSHVWGFGICSPSKGRKTTRNIEFLGASKYDFLAVEPDETKLKSVKVILITANCSKSAIINPVQFLVSEGEDIGTLGDLSQGSLSKDRINGLAVQHERLLKHALSFPRVQAVVYVTRSCNKAENEDVVNKSVKFAQTIRATRGIPFRVTPPVLPFTFDEIDSGRNGIDDLFIRFHASEMSNGCFIAVTSREPEDHKDGQRRILSFARAKRFLGKTKSTPLTTEEHDTKDTAPVAKGLRPSRSGNRRLKMAASTSEIKAGISSKLAGHSSPVAVGARLYQAGLVHKMEQRAKQKSSKSEQLTALKQPPPFSGTPVHED